MTLDWTKCQGNQWCNLFTVDLSHSHFQGLEGVYIIWHGGPSPATVYVGQGVIAERLASHRDELSRSRYASLGLFVTWTRVNQTSRDAVEGYLAQKLQPLEGLRHPPVANISVNLPW